MFGCYMLYRKQENLSIKNIYTYIYSYICIKFYSLTQLFVLDCSILYIYIYSLLIIEHNADVLPEKWRICHQINFFSPNGNFETQTIFITIFGICTCCQLLISSINLQLDFTLVEYTYL
jgi:hypothetical protein